MQNLLLHLPHQAILESGPPAMDTGTEDEGISLMLDRTLETALNPSAASSGVFSTASSGADSLTRALEELRLRDSEVEEEAETAAATAAAAAAVDAEADAEAWEVETFIKRCSSLKSSCSLPSGRCHRRRRARKKAVRFADSLGLDLVNVRHVVSGADSPPEMATPSRPRLLISPCFPQPGSCAGFISRVMSQKVMLERAGLVSLRVISGVIRVCNLHFEKQVTVRVTFDGWRSSREVSATYQALEPDCGGGGMTDQFAFEIPLPAEFGSTAGDRVAFCLRYSVAGQTYWDSNYGENYQFDCLPVGLDGCDSLASFR